MLYAATKATVKKVFQSGLVIDEITATTKVLYMYMLCLYIYLFIIVFLFLFFSILWRGSALCTSTCVSMQHIINSWINIYFY